jgi:hypothetical protein
VVNITGGDAKYKFYFWLNTAAIMWNERLRKHDRTVDVDELPPAFNKQMS